MITYKHLPNCPCPVDDTSIFNHMFESNDAIHMSMPISTLSSTFTDWLKQKNMFPSFLEIFYLPANCAVRHIHTDLGYITDRASKINYIIGGEDAPMQWFSVNDNKDGCAAVNHAPEYVDKGKVSPFLHWNRDQCTVISEAVLSGSNLVHAGIPHVVFTKTKARIAISVVLRDINTGQRLTCEEVVERI